MQTKNSEQGKSRMIRVISWLLTLRLTVQIPVIALLVTSSIVLWIGALSINESLGNNASPFHEDGGLLMLGLMFFAVLFSGITSILIISMICYRVIVVIQSTLPSAPAESPSDPSKD